MNTFDMTKRHACSLCDKAFSRKYDLKRHENTVHAQFEDDSNEEIDESEDSEIDEDESEMNDSENENDGESSEDEVSSDDLEDNLAYQEWYDQAMQAAEEKRAEKYEKYINQGMDEDEAKEKTYEKTLWLVKRIFFDNYLTFLSLNFHLKDDDTHQELMAELEEKTDEGVDIDKALKRIMGRYRPKFDNLFHYDVPHEVEAKNEDEETKRTEDSDDYRMCIV